MDEEPRRLLVCGGRRFDDRPLLDGWLDLYRFVWGELMLIVGYDPTDPKFQGADQLAYEWAKARGVKGWCFPAKWKEQGHAAGPIRNQRMLDKGKPHEVAAFEGGNGTANMVEKAHRARVDVNVVRARAVKEKS